MKKLLTFVLLSLTLVASAAFAKDLINNKNGVAIQGYDPVSYFKDGPVKGSKELTAEFEGVTYYFSSEENQKAFEEAPAKYVPAYGGWCAYAMVDGEKVSINPKSYKIVNGKLLLFYDKFFTDTLKLWNKKEEPEDQLISTADNAWSGILEDEK